MPASADTTLTLTTLARRPTALLECYRMRQFPSGSPGLIARGGKCSSPYSSARFSLAKLACSGMLLMVLVGASGNDNVPSPIWLLPWSSGSLLCMQSRSDAALNRVHDHKSNFLQIRSRGSQWKTWRTCTASQLGVIIHA